MACFRIHYGSTETRTLLYRPKYEFIELFSLLGGYSGLWLGFSLLNCFEFFVSKLIHLRRNASVPKRNLKKTRKRKFYSS
ncbi:hypothetical protein JTE90_003857 [Oedothorax gibbosus]|uniref:Uncharacterized protein n=1 Tax=Oedothorax gibbosus TaxID=931172 RepID=A0AAV6UIQ9_9ARAC|nr:hypothetical protein JTE90_003857 [Oedothorax gibbosus]